MRAAIEGHARSLDAIAKRLANLARSLQSEGLEEQAKSIETTIADLEWQGEELDSNELSAAVQAVR